jgi:hypothetical protein
MAIRSLRVNGQVAKLGTRLLTSDQYQRIVTLINTGLSDNQAYAQVMFTDTGVRIPDQLIRDADIADQFIHGS